MRTTLNTTEMTVLRLLNDAREFQVREVYGLDLISWSHGVLKPGTIYLKLSRLEDLGWIESRVEIPPADPALHPRRLYSITGKGRRALRSASKRDPGTLFLTYALVATLAGYGIWFWREALVALVIGGVVFACIVYDLHRRARGYQEFYADDYNPLVPNVPHIVASARKDDKRGGVEGHS